MAKMVLDLEKYTQCARKTAAEGQVLLRNEKGVLPIPAGGRVAVFGRIQSHYYKSGTGSGGMVNVDKVVGILDALLEEESVEVNQKLLGVYREWEKENPFNEGIGWGNEPWSQEEMPLTRELVREAAEESDYALVIIGRTAGEDQDNLNHPGSYLLAQAEEEMLKQVREGFEKMIVVLNVGNIMDMSFVEKYRPEAVLYAWQGGMVGGYGTVDVLTGRVNPCGKLSDTIAYKLSDYPSDNNFGNLDRDVYEEDIYVGYRYFETAAKEKVQYPFGFGLSYTDFEMEAAGFEVRESEILTGVRVKNTGCRPGKEVVQIYVSAPQGELGKPEKVLAAFGKTRELAVGEEEELSFSIPFGAFASYDETGAAGYESCYVLEKGEYRVWAGSSVRDGIKAGSFVLDETKKLSQCSQAMAPEQKMKRLKAHRNEDGSLGFCYEEAPVRKERQAAVRERNLPKDIPLTGDQGYKLGDVKEGRVSMEDFIAQLSEDDLSAIIRGEGMGSPKVTPGTAAAFGGISRSLNAFGIPCGCCTDGPSGMRMDSGAKAFSLPNGTLLACTFNLDLVEELFTFTGVEMVKNKIDALLGPGINIHRHPLNGRNFEYFSEDPLLTGKMAAAQIRAMHKAGVTGTIKHFCANNQETKRHFVNSVASERALREIYLKGYEIAVKEGGADSVMTSYGAVNGIWTAGNYELNTVILRGEWGFKGIVMTDWWATINDEGQACASKTNLAAMVRAQNDIYMVCPEADKNTEGDNTLSSLEAGTLTLGELQRNAMNICAFMMNTHAYARSLGDETNVEVIGQNGRVQEEEDEVIYYKADEKGITLNLETVKAKKGTFYSFALDLQKTGGYRVAITAKSDLGELAQMPVTLQAGGTPVAVFTFNGTGGEWTPIEKRVVFPHKYALLRLYFGQSGLDLKEIAFTFEKPFDELSGDPSYVM